MNNMKAHQLNLSTNNIEDVDKYAVMNPQDFKEIFKTTKSKTSSNDILEGFVKVQHQKQSIYRKFRSLNTINKGEVHLSYNSCCELNILQDIKQPQPVDVKVSPANKWVYYWCNSDSYVRLVFKLGLISIFIGIISIVVSFLAN
jgi:hypothetical protein